MSKLTPKQEAFANKYVECGNASQAYRFAYDVAETTKNESIHVRASELMADSKVAVRVKELQEMAQEANKITRQTIIDGYLSIIHDVDITFALAQGDLDKEDRAKFFRMMQQTKNTDKLRAFEALSKMLGLNEPDKIDHTIQKIEVVIKNTRDDE